VAEQGASPNDKTSEVSNEQREEVRKALEDSSTVEALPPFFEQQRKEREQDIVLKRFYAIGLLALLAVQIFVVDGVLFMYAWKGVAWRVEPLVVDIWVGATVVEVIAIVLVVTHHLFPHRDGDDR
jgi:hypothetical protein